MDYTNFFSLGGGYNLGTGLKIVVFLVAIWEIVWKGLGLWKAGRNGKSGWFIAILLLNTLGILPILYLYVFSPKETKNS